MLGFGDMTKDRFNVTITAQYENQQALFAKDRDFAETGNVFPYITAGATGQGNIEGGYTPGHRVGRQRHLGRRYADRRLRREPGHRLRQSAGGATASARRSSCS